MSELAGHCQTIYYLSISYILSSREHHSPPKMIRPPSRLGLLPSSLLVISILSTLIAAQTDNSNECSCFKTNGSSSAYYTDYRFHDFRNINSSLTSKPNVLTDANSTTNADFSSS